jgi:hypothetical protein
VTTWAVHIAQVRINKKKGVIYFWLENVKEIYHLEDVGIEGG